MMSGTRMRCGGSVDVTEETPRSGECEECAFDWTTPAPEAIELVEGSPARVADLFSGGAASRTAGAADPGRWSPAAYLWHLVDVIRFGTERLWTLALDPGAGFPGWDQDEMAAACRYDGLSTAVGVLALEVAVADWAVAAREAPPEAIVRLPVLGEMTTGDAVRRNAHEAVHHELDIRRGLGLA